MSKKSNVRGLPSPFVMRRWFGVLSLSAVLSFDTLRVDARLQRDEQNNTVCPLIHLFPFSNFVDQTEEEAQRTAKVAFSYLASAELAIQHFNERNPTVVPELADAEFDSCNVRLSTLAAVDSRSDKHAANDGLLFELDQQRNNGQWPCAFLGPEDAGSVEFVNSIAEPYGIWQISYHYAKPKPRIDPSLRGNASLAVGNRGEEATAALEQEREQGAPAHLIAGFNGVPPDSFVPSIRPHAEDANGLFLQYLFELSQGRNQYLAILYENVPSLLAQANGIARKGLDMNFNVRLFDSPIIRAQLQKAQKSGYRTIYPLLQSSHQVRELAEAADELGMLENDDYLFILNPRATGVRDISQVMGEQAPGSPLDKLLKGALLMDYLDQFSIYKEQDTFLQAWQSQNATTVNRLNAALPTTVEHYFSGMPEGYFQETWPLEQSTFVYDSVIALGMAACRVASSNTDPSPSEGRQPPQQQGDDVPPSMGRSPPTRPPKKDLQPSSNLFTAASEEKRNEENQSKLQLGRMQSPFRNGFAKNDFQGASGQVTFGSGESRSSPAYFGAYNVRATLNPETGINSYQAVLGAYTTTGLEETRMLSLSTGATTSSAREETDSLSLSFVHIPGEIFVYRSGSTVGPTEYRQYNEQNYLSTGVRIYGFILMAFCWMLALVAGSLVICFRNQPVIKYGQPIFLVLLCVGSIILASSILTLSLDEGTGWSQQQLDVACMLTPWLFFIGHIVTFSAIFCKLWRLEKVLQIQRGKVGAAQSVGPLVVFLAITITILIIWTSADPWQWERKVIDDINAETYGECTNTNWWAFFAPLMLCVVLSESIAAHFAIKTNTAPGELRESRSVFYTIFVQLQAWAVGVPILAVIGTSSADTTYIGRVTLIAFFAMSSVVFMVGSKLWRVIAVQDKHSDSLGTRNLQIAGLTPQRPNRPGYEQPSSSHDPQGRRSYIPHSGVDLERGESQGARTVRTGANREADEAPAIQASYRRDAHPFALHQPAPGAKLSSTEDSTSRFQKSSQETNPHLDDTWPESVTSATNTTGSPKLANGQWVSSSSSFLNESNLFHDSILQNVSSAGPDDSIAEMEQAAMARLNREESGGPKRQKKARKSGKSSKGTEKRKRKSSKASSTERLSSLEVHKESNLFHDSNLQNVSSACAEDDSFAEMERAAMAELNA